MENIGEKKKEPLLRHAPLFDHQWKEAVKEKKLENVKRSYVLHAKIKS